LFHDVNFNSMLKIYVISQYNSKDYNQQIEIEKTIKKIIFFNKINTINILFIKTYLVGSPLIIQ
jgi:hypothetical protein